MGECRIKGNKVELADASVGEPIDGREGDGERCNVRVRIGMKAMCTSILAGSGKVVVDRGRHRRQMPCDARLMHLQARFKGLFAARIEKPILDNVNEFRAGLTCAEAHGQQGPTLFFTLRLLRLHGATKDIDAQGRQWDVSNPDMEDKINGNLKSWQAFDDNKHDGAHVSRT